MGGLGGGGGGGGGQRERDIILTPKDNSIRSIWTLLTANPWQSTNTYKHD